MKFRLYFLPGFDREVHVDGATLYQQILAQVDLAETLNYDCVWCAEYHFSDYGGYIPNPAVMLAAIAQRTKPPLNTAE